jgi:membrane-bound metal-dependent hydrolase YbcI (DUF457 family)
MSLYVIFGIILIHWFADFVCQTDWEAQNKSKNNLALLRHTIKYTSIWVVFGALYCAFNSTPYIPFSLTLFALITFVSHTLTDYVTSRINSYLWNKKDVHNFFVSVGFDQVLHYVQLFLTFHFLT